MHPTLLPRPSPRPLRRPLQLHLQLLLALCALWPAFGCGEAGGGPSFDFARHFTPEEAIVEEGLGETRLRMEGIRFVSGTADLTPDSLPVLDRFADVFEALPGARYSIEGHTSSIGASSANLALSQARAAAVRSYLVDVVGGPAVAFITIGYGEDRPIADNATLAGRAMNDRIEIIVDDDLGDPVFLVTVSVDRLDVVLDCDDFTSSPSAAAGDFFMQVEFHSEDDRGLVLAARSPNTVVRLNAGESSDLDIVAEERFLASEGAILKAYVDWYENDTGDIEQFELTEEISLRYRAGERCWQDLDAEIIVVGDADASVYCTAPETGEIASGTMSVFQLPSLNVDGCIADLDWSVWVERVRR